MPARIKLPSNVRCAVAITYDTDTAGGYAPDGVCHGRTPPFLRDYMDMLCDTAEAHGVHLQFFQIANGLEVDEVVSHLREIMARGHAIDCHTYNHVNLAETSSVQLDHDLKMANELFRERLGIGSKLLRGPGGYPNGALDIENQNVILANSYRFVSGEYDTSLIHRNDWSYFSSTPSRNLPLVYPSGLVEIPFQGWTDRTWFDDYKLIDPAAYRSWRLEKGHRPVPYDWSCPWTHPDALKKWIEVNLACLDHAYENRLLWTLCWHPYSHYLHDRANTMLPALLEAAFSKPEKVAICTLRDALKFIVT